MDAARVVGAGRHAGRLARVSDLGADEVVGLDADDLPAAFRSAAGGDLDVVIDSLWGEPAMAALGVLATEGRLVNVGQSAGTDVRIPLEPVRNRQGAIHAISSGWTGLGVKALAYERLLARLRGGDVRVEHEVVSLNDVGAAWERQAESPGKKLVVRVGQTA
jgi:NADPH:quinone reductase